MVLICMAINSKHTGDSKARTSGYTHTYFDSEDIDLAALLTFATDNGIEELVKQAWEEADSLWTALSVSPTDFMESASFTVTPHLPSVSSWFIPEQDPVLDLDGFQPEEDDNENSDNNSDAAQLHALINDEERAHSWSNRVDDRMLELTTAAIAVELDETNLAWVFLASKIACESTTNLYFSTRQSFDNVTDKDQSASIQADSNRLSSALTAARLPSLNAFPAEASWPYDFGGPSFHIGQPHCSV